MFEFKLPDIGEGVVEGEIVQWLVKPGDAVDVDQPMVEVMTDKATVVIASPTKGEVRETRGSEGDLVQVHSVIALIEVEGEPREAAPAEPGTPAATEPSTPPARSDEPPSSSAGRALAAPATRRLARELGVDLESISGTGPGGRVMAEDVRRAGSGPVAEAPAMPPSVASDGEDQRVPVRGLRRRIWDNMARSTSTAARFTFVEELDATELQGVRARFNQRLGPDDVKLTFLPFIVKAVVAGLRAFPSLNGQIDETRMEFVQRARPDIGIAAASDRGLTVPVLRHADRCSLLEAAVEIKRLGDAVRTGTIGSEDLGGSTFTITSLGKDGGLFATPVINHPEVAILGVHRLRREPRVMDASDRIEVRSVMNLSLSFDHRWVDGHVGAAFTYHVIRLLQDPDQLFLEMI
jgi:pyruvate dehydrogenase E2 component (dihydrolipoamide acetyltransferase)